ncbi:MAG TPA: hypothetical protein VK850_04845 [Candidatus Binatia bacterium]|nr:hypothetical protein [Candidatus Binatia bacterium]
MQNQAGPSGNDAKGDSLPEPLLFATLALVLLAPMAIDDLHIKGQSLAKIMGVSPDFPFQWKVMEAFSREELWQPDQLVHIYFRQNYLGLGAAVSLLAFVSLIVAMRRGNGVRDATQSAGLPSEG